MRIFINIHTALCITLATIDCEGVSFTHVFLKIFPFIIFYLVFFILFILFPYRLYLRNLEHGYVLVLPYYSVFGMILL
jgi:hypothetical protein